MIKCCVYLSLQAFMGHPSVQYISTEVITHPSHTGMHYNFNYQPVTVSWIRYVSEIHPELTSQPVTVS